jgi:hypothetical protein
MQPHDINLTDDWFPTRNDTRTRLHMVGELFGFPFYIDRDETATAYGTQKEYAENTDSTDPAEMAARWLHAADLLHINDRNDIEAFLSTWFQQDNGEDAFDALPDEDQAVLTQHFLDEHGEQSTGDIVQRALADMPYSEVHDLLAILKEDME